MQSCSKALTCCGMLSRQEGSERVRIVAVLTPLDRARESAQARSEPRCQPSLTVNGQAAGNRREGVDQVAADGAEDPDDRHGNKGCDQAVFNRGGALVVVEELVDEGHDQVLFGGLLLFDDPDHAKNLLRNS